MLTGECEVWWASPDSARPAHLALLDATELERMERLRRPADRARFTVAAALLRLVAARQTGQDPARITVDRRCGHCGRMDGKPRLPGSGFGVSISHSGGRVVVACGRGLEVGVDVEEFTHQAEIAPLVRCVLTDAEAQSLHRLDGAERTHGFLTFWTRKEAALKTTGDGLRVPMRSVAVSPPGQWPELVAYDSRPELVGRLCMWPLDAGPGHLATVGVLPAGAPDESMSVQSPLEFDAQPLLEGSA